MNRAESEGYNMERIRQKDLEYLTKRINEVTDSPIATCTKDKITGRYAWNIGNYHLDYADGGVQLVQTVNEHGGVSAISGYYHGTKRELYNWMQAFLAGIAIK